jgi:thiol-disulfide isomerase/thioredoxin|tara:strand:- start:211 stop:699 length:489 start_codon:yes stop_codon:yes gene_type:complete
MFKRNIILLLLTLTIVIVLFNSTNNEEIEIINYSNVNDGVVLKDLTKISTINLNDQFVILNLWASWCIPCESEVSELKIISETKGYSVIGILVEDSAENGMEFIKKNKITYQNVLDSAISESILIQFIWSGIPTTLVLDNNLNIISTISGEITANQIFELTK